jgi:hypothetical protein
LPEAALAGRGLQVMYQFEALQDNGFTTAATLSHIAFGSDTMTHI